jgi:protoheme ferro-lyase
MANSNRRTPTGELQPLPIPERPWSSISMEFIEKLPESDGYDSILVVVDRFTKMGIFIPTVTPITTQNLADLFVRHVFSKHGIPSDIVSDRGSKFTPHYWTALSQALKIKQNLSTAYHPLFN